MAKEPPETEEQRAKKKEKKASDDRIKKKDKKEKKERKLIAELDIRLKADPPNKPPKAAVENGGSLPAPMPLSELVDEVGAILPQNTSARAPLLPLTFTSLRLMKPLTRLWKSIWTRKG